MCRYYAHNAFYNQTIPPQSRTSMVMERERKGTQSGANFVGAREAEGEEGDEDEEGIYLH